MSKNSNVLDLKELRSGLLTLHKQLLGYQLTLFEQKHGRVQASRAMFYIVNTEPSFAWLRQITVLIVGIDELLDELLDELIDKKGYSPANIKALYSYTKKLLAPPQNRYKIFQRIL